MLIANSDLASMASSWQPPQLGSPRQSPRQRTSCRVIVSANLGGLVHDFKLVFFLLLISLDRVHN